MTSTAAVLSVPQLLLMASHGENILTVGPHAFHPELLFISEDVIQSGL